MITGDHHAKNRVFFAFFFLGKLLIAFSAYKVLVLFIFMLRHPGSVFSTYARNMITPQRQSRDTATKYQLHGDFVHTVFLYQINRLRFYRSHHLVDQGTVFLLNFIYSGVITRDHFGPYGSFGPGRCGLIAIKFANFIPVSLTY
jgi:hypothetical protein